MELFFACCFEGSRTFKDGFAPLFTFLMKQIYFGRTKVRKLIYEVVHTSNRAFYVCKIFWTLQLHSCSIFVSKILCTRSAN